MAFDPEAYLAKKKTAAPVKSESKTTFDPDAYLAKKSQPKPEPVYSLPEKIGGVGEAALSTVTSGLGGFAGGLAYIAGQNAPMGSDAQGQRLKSEAEQALTYQPRSEAGQKYVENIGEFIAPIAEGIESYSQAKGDRHFEQTNSPIRSTAAYMMPRLAAEALSFFSGGALAKIARAKSAKAKGEGDSLARKTELELQDAEYKDMVDKITSAKPEEIAALIDAEPSIINAIDELGLDVEPLASYYSNNPRFRAIEQGLASVDAQDLNINDKAFVSALAKKADDIIINYGGDTGRTALSASIRKEMDDTANATYEAETLLYDNIREKLPLTTKVNASSTLAWLDREIVNQGGIDNIDPKLAKLYRDLKPKQGKGKGAYDYSTGSRKAVDDVMPNYGLLDDRRKVIGQQLGSKMAQTDFKSTELGKLKSLYAVMKEDQMKLVQEQGSPTLSSMQRAADNLTVQRKVLEEQMKTLFGKELDENLVNIVGAATAGLKKSDIDHFEAIVNSIPENRRGEAVLSSMNEAWKGTAASKQQLGEAQFAVWWTRINRDPELKERFFKYLPEESRKAIQNLGDVNNAVYRAHQDKISTGRIDSFLEDSGGSMNRLMNNLLKTKTGKAVDAAGSIVTRPVTGKGVKDFLENKSDRAKAANEMLASTRFRNIIKEAVKNDVHVGKPLNAQQKRIEKAYMESESFKKWANTLDEVEKKKVYSLGVTNYLLSPKMEVIDANEEKDAKLQLQMP